MTTKKSRNNPISGMFYFLRGFGLITHKGVKRYVAIPLTINVVLFSGAIYFGYEQFSVWMDQIQAWLPEWLAWLATLLLPVFAVAVLLMVFFTFSILGNLIAGPFNGLLAEAVERNLTGRTLDTEAGIKRLLKDLVRSVLSELRKLVYLLLWSIPILILSLIPVLNIAAPFVWILFTAWMLAVGYADYPMANHQLFFPQQRRILKEKRLLILGFGATAAFALAIPLVNFLVIPASVAGVTAMWVEQLADTGTAVALRDAATA